MQGLGKAAAIAAGLMLAGCGPMTDEAGEEFVQGEEELTAYAWNYVTLRADTRRCMAPLCGGYWIRDVNKTTAEQYVSRLDFAKSVLGNEERELVRSAPAGDLVIRGRLGAAEPRYRTRPLLVLDAWRALPGTAARSGDVFYKAALRSPQITCVAAPCNNAKATKLGGSSTYFTRLSLDGAVRPFADRAWLEDRILAHEALVTAHFEAGARLPAGTEKVLVPSRVFLRISDVLPDCPVFRLAACPDGQTRTMRRNAERCLIPGPCVEPGFCTMSIPVCDRDYALEEWPGGGGACPEYACDPEFAVP